MRHFILLSFIIISSCDSFNSQEISLFNGSNFNGWEGENQFFRIENKAIVGGSLKSVIDKSYYLCTDSTFENFELSLEVKFNTKNLNVNGGISFRADRVPDSHEVMGYQADVGYIDINAIPRFSRFKPISDKDIYPLWGSLVDENRIDTSIYPNPEIFPVIFHTLSDEGLIEKIINPHDWNKISILANKNNLEIRINDVLTSSYVEKNSLSTKGKICLQVHSGEKFEVWYRNIFLKTI